MTVSPGPTKPVGVPECTRIRSRALQHLSCWGVLDPTRAVAQQRSAPLLLRRVLWAENWKREHDSAPTCRVCGRLWTPRTGELHEALPSLARSAFADLIPLCRAHHAALHRTIRGTGAAARLGYRDATQVALMRLRERHSRLAG